MRNISFSKGVLAVLVFCLMMDLPCFANPPTIKDISNGLHSIQKLNAGYGSGDGFSIPIDLHPVYGAKLVLWNDRAARRLGLSVPSDPAELEALALQHFALFIDPKNASRDVKGGDLILDDSTTVTASATFYQDDSTLKRKGDALGDGRAAWIGEMKVKEPDGSEKTLDVSLKGIGATPLTWSAHSSVGHKNGLQSLSEAVYSFIRSEANVENGLDSTVDLAVIELPEVGADGKPVAITVRVGNNIRQAHFRFHQDDPKKFKALFEYTLRRDLGLAEAAPIGKAEVRRYLQFVSSNLANETARYQDLYLMHGSPTSGNRTSSGGTIDIGNFMYLDGPHSGFKLKEKSYEDNPRVMKGFFRTLAGYMKKANYFNEVGMNINSDEQLDAFIKPFEDSFDSDLHEKLGILTLRRIGLSSEDIENVQKSCQEKSKDFLQAAGKLQKIQSPVEVGYAAGQSRNDKNERVIRPNVFRMRRIFAYSMTVLGNKNKKVEAWEILFSGAHYPKLALQSYPQEENGYRSALEGLIHCLDKDLTEEQKKEELQRRALLAHQINKNLRNFQGGANTSLDTAVVKMAEDEESPKKFQEISEEAMKVVDKFLDQDLDHEPPSPHVGDREARKSISFDRSTSSTTLDSVQSSTSNPNLEACEIPKTKAAHEDLIDALAEIMAFENKPAEIVRGQKKWSVAYSKKRLNRLTQVVQLSSEGDPGVSIQLQKKDLGTFLRQLNNAKVFPYRLKDKRCGISQCAEFKFPGSGETILVYKEDVPTVLKLFQ